MILQFFGSYVLICDVCGREIDEFFFDYPDALEFKENNGWKGQKNKEEWEDICPECSKARGV